MDPVLGDIVKAITGAGPVAALLFYFLRQKEAALDRANAKIDSQQGQIVAMLQSQLESEPQRRETLAGIARLVQEQSALLKERASA